MTVDIHALAPALAQTSVRDLVAAGRAALEQAGSFDEVKAIAAQADALRVYQRSIGASSAAINAAAELKVRAERRMWLALADAEIPRHRPRSVGLDDTSKIPPTLSEIGVKRDQSSRYQTLAAIPEETFEAVVEAHQTAPPGEGEAAVAHAAGNRHSAPGVTAALSVPPRPRSAPVQP